MRISSNSREGVDMMESEETERDGSEPTSLSLSCSSSVIARPSDASSRKSNGEPLPRDDEALTSFCHSFLRCSMDTRLGNDADVLGFGLRGGIVVFAKIAATEAGSGGSFSLTRPFFSSLRDEADACFLTGMDIGCDVGVSLAGAVLLLNTFVGCTVGLMCLGWVGVMTGLLRRDMEIGEVGFSLFESGMYMGRIHDRGSNMLFGIPKELTGAGSNMYSYSTSAQTAARMIEHEGLVRWQHEKPTEDGTHEADGAIY